MKVNTRASTQLLLKLGHDNDLVARFGGDGRGSDLSHD